MATDEDFFFFTALYIPMSGYSECLENALFIKRDKTNDDIYYKRNDFEIVLITSDHCDNDKRLNDWIEVENICITANCHKVNNEFRLPKKIIDLYYKFVEENRDKYKRPHSLNFYIDDIGCVIVNYMIHFDDYKMDEAEILSYKFTNKKEDWVKFITDAQYELKRNNRKVYI